MNRGLRDHVDLAQPAAPSLKSGRRAQRHWTRRARRRVGPDAGRQGAVRGRAPRTALPQRRRPVRRARATATSSRPSADVALLPRGARRAVRRRRPSAPCCRFPRTRSIRIAAWRRTSASRRPAPGRCTRSHAARRASSSRRRRRCCRASARRTACSTRRSSCKPGQDIAPADLGRAAGRRRVHAARIPADEHGEFAVRGGILDVFPAGEPQPVRLEFIGDTIESLRTYDPATQRSIAPIDQLTIVRCGTCCRGSMPTVEADALDGATRSLGDALRLPVARRTASRILVSERDEVDADRRQARRAAAATATKTRGRTRGRPAAAATGHRWSLDWDDDRRARLADGTDARRSSRLDDDALSRGRARRRRPRPLSAGASSSTAASPTGSPRFASCREAGETTLFVAATPGRAERTIELLKEYDVFAVPVERAEDARYAAVLVGDRQSVARLPAARRRPADLRRGRRLRGGAPRARAPPVRHQGVSLRPARPEGRRSRRPRRPRHRRVRRPEADRRRRQRRRSSSSCATPATTSCSSRSSGSISSRSTPARRGRRSTGWAARRGSARRRASRRPCATWPRSC